MLTVAELLRDAPALLRLPIAVSAIIVTPGPAHDTWLVDSFDHLSPDANAVRVAWEELPSLLLATVPAWGGGKYCHIQRTVVKGTLTRSERPPFIFQLGDITSLEVLSGESTYRIR